MSFTTYRNGVILLQNGLETGAIVLGDAGFLEQGDLGGNDRIFGGANGVNEVYGDATTMFSGGRGGNDIITGGENSENLLYGDANVIYSGGIGGNDRNTGPAHAAASAPTLLTGDSQVLANNTIGGNDQLIARPGNDTVRAASGAVNLVYGDSVFALFGDAGGNDRLYGGSSGAHNLLCGDSENGFLIQCGDDLPVAGNAAVNLIYGDCINNLGGAVNGSDRIIVGTGKDTMTGDTIGCAPVRDTFVFTANTGSADVITDFQQGTDIIEIGRRTGLKSFSALDTEADGNGNLILHLGGHECRHPERHHRPHTGRRDFRLNGERHKD